MELKLYSGCQKNVPLFKRFFLQPLMPLFRYSEHYYGKRYKWQLREEKTHIPKLSSKHRRVISKYLWCEICRFDVQPAKPVEIFYSPPYQRRNDAEIHSDVQPAPPSNYRQKGFWEFLSKHLASATVSLAGYFNFRMRPCPRF